MITGFAIGAIASFLTGMFSATSTLPRNKRLPIAALLGVVVMYGVIHISEILGLP